MRTDAEREGRSAIEDLSSPHLVAESEHEVNGPSFDPDNVYGLEQRPQDMIDEAIMESFPCSDPPSYSCCHI